MERSKRTVTAAIIFLVIFHEIGIVGLHLEQTKSLFQSLTPLNLILSVGVLGLFHRQWTPNFGIFAFIIFWAGYLVELIGISTGAIFGVYQYGGTLGPKVAGVPPIIGLNWLMLVYCSGILSQGLTPNLWLRTTLGAIFMVFLDILIEPVAMRYDFWTWQGGSIPLQNYFAWFVISWAMQYGFHTLHQEKSNPIAVPLYVILILFFGTFWVIDG